MFFFSLYSVHRGRRLLTRSCPTRRSSDLGTGQCVADPRRAGPTYGKYAVTDYDDATGTVISGSTTGQGAFAVDAPRTSMRRKKRSEEHTSELQSLMRISYAVFCVKKKNAKVHL